MKKLLIIIFLLALLTGCLFSEQKPDLTISNMKYDEVDNSIKVKVLNEGRENAKSFFVEAYEGENFLGSTEVVGIGRGGQFTATISGVSLSNGSHTIQATVDPQNNIRESNEKNNEFEITIIIGEDTTPPGEEEIDLQKLIQKGKNQANVHYVANFSNEIFSTNFTVTGTIELWQKNSEIKTITTYEKFDIPDELSDFPIISSTIAIEKGEFYYTKHLPKTGDFDWIARKHSDAMRIFNYLRILEKLENANDIEILGKERIGTKNVIHLSFYDTRVANKPQYEVWIDIESGIPLKIKNFSELGTTIAQITEIDFEEIDENIFEMIGTVDYSMTIENFVPEVYTYKEEIVEGDLLFTKVRVDGALVEITSVDTGNSWQCTTDINGRCTIEGFNAGEYNLKITKEECKDITINYNSKLYYLPFYLTCGGDYAKFGKYRVQVETNIDEDGRLKKLVDGALVELTLVNTSNSWQCTTEEYGECSIDSFTAGEYDVKVSKQGCEVFEEKVEYEVPNVFDIINIVCENP